MKISLLLLGSLGLAVISKSDAYKDSYFNRLQLVYSVFYRVHDRFNFDDLRNYGIELNVEKSAYDFWTEEMDDFLRAFRSRQLLPRGEFFGGLIEAHAKQAHGLFLFLYNAGSMETIMGNICWARVHLNEAMLFQAVNLFKFYYRSWQSYDLPLVHEVFPEHFFSWKYVVQAEKFNATELGVATPQRTALKPWQWWMAMGFDNNWHAEHEFILRDTIHKRLNDQKYWKTLKGLNFWWLPVDYTREFGAENEITKMSYFMEDVEWNSYWYYLNMGYSTQFSGDKLPLNVGSRGEFWLFTVQQLMTRYFFERMTHKLGDIPKFTWGEFENISYHQTYLVASTHQSLRSFQDYDSDSKLLKQAREKLDKIEQAIDMGYYELKNGTKISLREPEAIEILGNLLQSNADAIDAHETDFNWYMQAITAFSNWSQQELPHLLLNFETMMRDPFSYSFHQHLAELYHKFKSKLPPYTKEQIDAEGIFIENVEVSGFETFFDLFDFDLSSLTKQPMKFDKSGFRQENVLLARQMRLNHETIKYNITIKSDKYRKVNVHIFLGPKFDEQGKVLSLIETRKNLFSLDQYKCELMEGLNDCSGSSANTLWTGNDRRVLAERYHYIRYMTAGFTYAPNNYDSEDTCAFPKRLVLPRGWKEGMPMRLFIVVENGREADVFREKHCLRRISAKSFGYPFDRVITDESLFALPNMRSLDVNITHVDPFETYFKHYNNLGKFDYNFFNSYYHKNIEYKKYRTLSN